MLGSIGVGGGHRRKKVEEGSLRSLRPCPAREELVRQHGLHVDPLLRVVLEYLLQQVREKKRFLFGQLLHDFLGLELARLPVRFALHKGAPLGHPGEDGIIVPGLLHDLLHVATCVRREGPQLIL